VKRIRLITLLISIGSQSRRITKPEPTQQGIQFTVSTTKGNLANVVGEELPLAVTF
jgi:hypothetical protein